MRRVRLERGLEAENLKRRKFNDVDVSRHRPKSTRDSTTPARKFFDVDVSTLRQCGRVQMLRTTRCSQLKSGYLCIKVPCTQPSGHAFKNPGHPQFGTSKRSFLHLANASWPWRGQRAESTAGIAKTAGMPCLAKPNKLRCQAICPP